MGGGEGLDFNLIFLGVGCTNSLKWFETKALVLESGENLKFYFTFLQSFTIISHVTISIKIDGMCKKFWFWDGANFRNRKIFLFFSMFSLFQFKWAK